MTTVTMSIRLEGDMKHDLAALAVTRGQSVNNFIYHLLRAEIRDTRANMDKNRETAKAEVKRLTAVSMKFLDKAPGEKVTPEDFDEGELGRDYVEEIVKDEDYRDGIDYELVEDDLDSAKLEFIVWSTCIEKLGENPPEQGIVDEEGHITRETRKRIIRIRTFLEVSDDDLMAVLGSRKRGRLHRLLNGHHTISARARDQLAAWLEHNEEEITDAP